VLKLSNTWFDETQRKGEKGKEKADEREENDVADIFILVEFDIYGGDVSTKCRRASVQQVNRVIKCR